MLNADDKNTNTLSFKCLDCGVPWSLDIDCTVEQLYKMDKHSERISKLKDKIRCPNLKYH